MHTHKQTEHKRAEKALRDSEARYRALCETSADGILIADIETKRFNYANQAACRMYGYTAEQLRTMGVADITPKEDLPRVVAEFEALVRGEQTIAVDIPCLRKDGTIVYADINTTRITIDGRQCMVGFFRDITEHKRADAALRLSELHLQVVLDTTADGILAVDNKGHVIKANRRFAELWRIPESLLDARDDQALLAYVLKLLSEPEAFLEKVQALYGSTATDVDTLTFKDGRLLERYSAPMLMAGSVIGRVWSFRDITQRKRAEERIRKLNRVYAMLSNINQAIVRIRDPQKLYNEACRIAVEDGGLRMAWIGLTDPTGGRVSPAAHAGVTDGYLEKLQTVLGDHARSGGPAGSAINTGKHWICNDIQNDPCMVPWHEDTLRNGYHSAATFPLKVSGEVRGVFGLYAAEVGFFDDDEVKLIDELAMDIGFAMEFVETEADRKRAEEKIERNYEMETAMNALLSLSMEDTTIAEFLEQALKLLISIQWLKLGDAKGAIFLTDDKGKELLMQTAHGLTEDQRAKCARIPFGYCICGRAAAARQVEFADGVDARHEVRYDGMAPHGHYCVPILSGDRMLGVINLYVKGGHARNLQEEEFLKAVANALGGAIERKRAEEALREANRQLNAALAELKTSQAQMIQQARLGALGQMASGIAHDFNNLLVPLLGFSELLLNDASILKDPKETQELLTAMHTAARDARNLIRRLREFYHPDETLETEDVNLNYLIEESLSLTEPRWKRQAQARGAAVTIRQEHGELPTVTCNRTQMREVFTNLILNAVDAMPEGGTLEIGSQAEGEGVAVTLRDSGTGMSEEVLQHCLEPYFTTKGAKGTGMGLAMAYVVIQKHGGSIEIESEVGKGTTVTIHLPLKPPRSEKAVVAPVHVAAKRSLRVLAVDDEEWVLSLVGRYLKSAGHTVEKAANGDEAIRKFAKGRFDLVITDRAMPDMSGDQVAKAVKEQSPKTPVLLLTGFGETMKEEDEHPEGVDVILSKPMTHDELLQAIEKVMGGSDQ